MEFSQVYIFLAISYTKLSPPAGFIIMFNDAPDYQLIGLRCAQLQ
jgi:hypothetical protein